MRKSLAAAAAAASLAGGCDHHADIEGPSGLAYACGAGRGARIHYDGGDPNRMPARLSFDGREFTLRPAPALNGLRYRSDEGLAPGRALVWQAEGDGAAISELPLDPAAAEGEREIARCERLREGEAAPAGDPGSHGDDH